MSGLQAWCSDSANGQVWGFHIVLRVPPLQVQAKKTNGQNGPHSCAETASLTEVKVVSVITRDRAIFSASDFRIYESGFGAGFRG